MARTLFFRMVLRKFSEITNNKPIFSQYNIFYNYEYFFFQSAFWSLFNHRQRSQLNQEQCSICCSSPCFLVLLCTHYRPLQCFSTYFRKSKEMNEFFGPYFQTMLFPATMVLLVKPLQRNWGAMFVWGRSVLFDKTDSNEFCFVR